MLIYTYRVQLKKADYCQVDVKSDNPLTVAEIHDAAITKGNREFGDSDWTGVGEIESVGTSPSSRRQTQEYGAKYSKRIFSGDYSVKMWDGINNSKTVEDLRWALYCVCCRLQELESKLAPLFELQENNLDSKEID